MRTISLRRAIGAALAVLSLGAAATAVAEDQDIIDYRLHIMKTLAAEVSLIDLIVQKKVPSDSVAAHARILAVVATSSKPAFVPKQPSAHAKPVIWANWSDFSSRLDAMIVSAEELAKSAQTGDVTEVEARLQAAKATCKGCHDIYVVPKS